MAQQQQTRFTRDFFVFRVTDEGETEREKEKKIKN